MSASAATFLATPADLKYLRLIGADAVGMSTVPEVTIARHGGTLLVSAGPKLEHWPIDAGQPVRPAANGDGRVRFLSGDGATVIRETGGQLTVWGYGLDGATAGTNETVLPTEPDKGGAEDTAAS